MFPSFKGTKADEMKTTKELARELGLIRKRSSTAGTSGARKIFKTNQIFDYLIVLDYESTCWKDSKYRTQEIIEFPAVLLNTSTGKVESEFQYYVQPQESPILSDFCKQLTGISQQQVNEGIPISLCLAKFTRWLRQISLDKSLEFNTSTDESKKRCTFVTWSDWDLGVCLLYECKRKQLRKPAELNSWIDLRATYRKFYERKPQGLNGALQDLGIIFEGREHSGLDDAKNTARLAWRMMSDGCVMQITKTLAGPVKSQVGQRYTAVRPATLGSIPQGIIPNKPSCKNTTTPYPIFSDIEKTPSKENGKLVLSSETAGNNVKTSENVMHCLEGCIYKNGVPPGQKSASGQVATALIADAKGLSNRCAVIPAPAWKTTSAIINKVRTEAHPNVRTVQQPVTNSFRKFSPKKDNFSGYVAPRRGISDVTNIKTNAANTPIGGHQLAVQPKHSVSVQPQIFSLDESDDELDCSLVSSGVESGRRHVEVYKPKVSDISANSFRTPSFLPKASGTGQTTMKRTPPMCKCGRRANRKVVQSPGPNMGRPFYSCPNGRGKASGGKSGCGFFKWESLHVHASPVLRTPTNNNNSSVSSTSYENNGSFIVPPGWGKIKTSPASHLAAIAQPKFDSPGQV